MNSKVKYGILASVLLVVAVIGFSFYQSIQYKNSFINEVDRNLAAEDKKIFEDRAAAAENAFNETDNPDVKYNLLMQKGFNLYSLGKVKDARDTFRRAVELKPNDYTGYAGLFQAQLDMNDIKGAEASINKALEMYPVDPELWKRKVTLLEKKGESNDNISSTFSQAINSTNNSVDIIVSYALWLEKAGNLQAAKEYWQKAIEGNPTNKAAYEAEIKRIDSKLQNAQ